MAKTCPWCGAKVKGHPNKKFCNQRHKDAYHNTTNPRGYGVDPDRPEYRSDLDPDFDPRNSIHPFSSEAFEE